MCFIIAFRGFRRPLERSFERPLKASIKGLDRILTSHTKVLGRRLSTYYKDWTCSATSFGTSYYFTCLDGLPVYPWLFAQHSLQFVIYHLLFAIVKNYHLQLHVIYHVYREIKLLLGTRYKGFFDQEIHVCLSFLIEFCFCMTTQNRRQMSCGSEAQTISAGEDSIHEKEDERNHLRWEIQNKKVFAPRALINPPRSWSRGGASSLCPGGNLANGIQLPSGREDGASGPGTSVPYLGIVEIVSDGRRLRRRSFGAQWLHQNDELGQRSALRKSNLLRTLVCIFQIWTAADFDDELLTFW